MYSVPCCPYFPSWVDPGQSSDQKVHQSEFAPVISGVKVLSVVCCTLNNHIKACTERTLTLSLISPSTAWNENIFLVSGKELPVKKNLPREELLANSHGGAVFTCHRWQEKPLLAFPPLPQCLCTTGMRLWMWKATQGGCGGWWCGPATPEMLWRPDWPALCIKIISTRKERWVIVVQTLFWGKQRVLPARQTLLLGNSSASLRSSFRTAVGNFLA